jgi:MarR family transcriptional regulator, transcriptional regulator for hemolysin
MRYRLIVNCPERRRKSYAVSYMAQKDDVLLWPKIRPQPPASLDLKRHLIFELIESSWLLRDYIDHRAKVWGTTRAQWTALAQLRRREGLSQVDLADALEMRPISIVRLVGRLVEQNLVEWRPDSRDRRINRLFLTYKGLDSLRDSIATDVLQETCVGSFTINAMGIAMLV